MAAPEPFVTGRDHALSLVRLAPDHGPALEQFFSRLAADMTAATLFHPHSFTAAQAVSISRYAGRDYYAGMLVDAELCAYGLLRGWDEGYSVPSLGIAVDAAYRGRGFGRLMMEYLHGVARLRRAPRIMLKVYKANTLAATLYRRLGYELSELNDLEWRGILSLQTSKTDS